MEDIFCNLLFSFLNNKVILKGKLSFKVRICSLRNKFFSLRVASKKFFPLRVASKKLPLKVQICSFRKGLLLTEKEDKHDKFFPLSDDHNLNGRQQ